VYIASDGAVMRNAERDHAIALAGSFSDLGSSQVVSVKPVFNFEGEYGFINKRLPVWRVEYGTPDRVTYYVETSTGALASVVHTADRAEGYSFSFLHKYHWLDFAGKNVRDGFMALLALGIASTALLGLWLLGRRYVVSNAKNA
jgi:hypothetical protein